MTAKSRDFHGILNFRESRRAAFRKLLGWLASDLTRLRMSWLEFQKLTTSREIITNVKVVSGVW